MVTTNTTHVCLVLDRSGSMQAVHDDAYREHEHELAEHQVSRWQDLAQHDPERAGLACAQAVPGSPAMLTEERPPSSSTP